MRIKVLIFDFDGTIGDTLPILVDITNSLAVAYGYQPASQEEIAKLQNLTSREIIRHSGISIFKVPFLVKKVRSELGKHIQEVRPIAGMKEALLELKAQGNQLAIITSNSKTNVTDFIQANSLDKMFDFVYSGTNLFGKDKVINKFLRQGNFRREEAIYVGDETRDIEAAKKSQIKAIAVSWGFNSKEVLAAQNPDFLVHYPSELVEVVKKINGING